MMSCSNSTMDILQVRFDLLLVIFTKNTSIKHLLICNLELTSIFRNKKKTNLLINEDKDSDPKRNRCTNPSGFEYKNDELFVIEDESHFTMEDNNQPAKVNVVELGHKKIQIARLHLSIPDNVEVKSGDFDEEIRNRIRHVQDNSDLRASRVEDFNMDTERDAI